jgi:fermentation-respiration switch protein FrsA (DUF1100 family)
LLIMLRWFEHRQVYRPTREWVASAAEVDGSWEDVIFPATDGIRLSGWFIPAAPTAKHPDLAMLICHGNGGNISHRVDFCRLLLDIGTSVLIFDYRGYGRSEGRADEEGTYRDAQGAYLWLRERGFAGGDIVAFGDSLGGGVAAELALREPLAGLALKSTFSSIPDIGAELFPWLPVRWLSTIKYDTRAKLPRVKCPVLVMHSRDDGLVPFHHAERNFAAANEPKMLWELGGDHNYTVTSNPDLFRRGFEAFVALVESGSR